MSETTWPWESLGPFFVQLTLIITARQRCRHDEHAHTGGLRLRLVGSPGLVSSLGGAGSLAQTVQLQGEGRLAPAKVPKACCRCGVHGLEKGKIACGSCKVSRRGALCVPQGHSLIDGNISIL
jgi:hypothetical protein